MNNKLYFGIDLGTTNSAIAYGYVNENGNLKTVVKDIKRIGKEGGQESKQTLPSVVHFKSNTRTGEITEIVGDFAKNQYGKKKGTVVKSVKSSMGEIDRLELDEKVGNKSPEEISSLILKHLLFGIKDKLSLDETPKNVIITIPASFGSDQCNATLRAGELAGLDIRDENGNYKDILLSEPKAVIYNISNMLSLGEIPKTTIDFSTQKNVLVFDLGGGTLDVALYQVYNDKSLEFPVINELAIGRYSKIGGDNFDSLLAKDLVKRFLECSNMSLSNVEMKELTRIMENKAEYLKLELSDKVFSSKREISDDEEFEIYEMELYKGAEFETIYTKRDIERVLSPLMGVHLKKDDYKRIDSLTTEKDIDNIIYPVLDVLAKAKDYGYSTDVDSVILNGGMTKFYLIKDRLEELFNVKPVVINDPDLSVAQGAAYYQYCLEKLDISRIKEQERLKDTDRKVVEKAKETSILDLGRVIVNEDINLGLTKGYIHKLIKAGTELPTTSESYSFNLLETTNKIELPIYVGRGKSTNLPNRKIATRVVKLSKVYPAGTKITLIGSIDTKKSLTLTGYVGDNEQEKISIEIDTRKEHKNTEKSVKISGISEVINPAEEFEHLRVNSELLEKIRTKNLKDKGLTSEAKNKQEDIKYKIKNSITSIRNCTNKKECEKHLFKRLNTLDNYKIFKSILFEVGTIIFDDMSKEGQENFKRACRGMLNANTMGNNLNKDTVTKSIISLADIKDTESVPTLEKLITDPNARNYIVNIVRAIGKLSADNELIIKKFMDLSIENNEIDAYIYAVGKSLSRNVSTMTDKRVKSVVEKLMKILKLEKANKDLALTAIGEICNRLDGVEYGLEDKFVEKIGTELSQYIKDSTEEKHSERARLVLYVIQGLDLTEEEKEQWNKMMSK